MATEWLAAREAAGTRPSVFWYRPQHSAVKLDDGERGDIWTRELGKCEQYGTELASVVREARSSVGLFSGRKGQRRVGDASFMLQRARLDLRGAPVSLRRRRCFSGTAVSDRADEVARRAAAVWITSNVK